MGMIIMIVLRIFQINQIKFVPSTPMSQSQRQSATIHSQTNQYYAASKVSKQKKRIIKKEKIVGGQNTSSNKLTKEQRMRIQKEKNRQAAQRSRDQHKQYVNSLELEVKYLKQQLQINKNICFKCKQELSIHQTFFEPGLKQQDIFQQQLFLNVESSHSNQECQITPQPEDAAEYFLRPKEEEQDYSYIKMMLFVAMIVVAVIIFPTNSNPTENGRNLVEIYKPSQSSPIIKDQFTIVSQDDYQSNQLNTLSPVGGLVIRNELINEKCINSLVNQKSYSLTNLRTSQISYKSQNNEGILLCSYEQPTIPSISTDHKHPQFLRLFMLGAQIKQMLGVNSPIKQFLHNKVQLNGIYKIGAQIKQVELISQHNCLL